MKFAVISVVLMLRIFQIFGGPPDRENTSKPPEKIRISDTLAVPGVLSADTLVRMGRSCEERLEYTKAYHYYTLAYRAATQIRNLSCNEPGWPSAKATSP